MLRSLHLPAKDLGRVPSSATCQPQDPENTIFSSIKCECHFHPVVKENNKATKEYAIYIIKH